MGVRPSRLRCRHRCLEAISQSATITARPWTAGAPASTVAPQQQRPPQAEGAAVTLATAASVTLDSNADRPLVNGGNGASSGKAGELSASDVVFCFPRLYMYRRLTTRTWCSICQVQTAATAPLNGIDTIQRGSAIQRDSARMARPVPQGRQRSGRRSWPRSTA